MSDTTLMALSSEKKMIKYVWTKYRASLMIHRLQSEICAEGNSAFVIFGKTEGNRRVPGYHLHYYSKYKSTGAKDFLLLRDAKMWAEETLRNNEPSIEITTDEVAKHWGDYDGLKFQ